MRIRSEKYNMTSKEIQHTIEGFSSYLSNKGRKSSTIKRYIYDVESFIQWAHQSKGLLTILCGNHYRKKILNHFLTI